VLSEVRHYDLGDALLGQLPGGWVSPSGATLSKAQGA